MRFTKKAQYYSQPEPGGGIWTWFIAFILLFTVLVLYFTITKPFIAVDDELSPRINLTTANNDAQEVVNKIRLYWAVWPIMILASIILWAFFNSIKQDPNHPYL